MHNGYEINTPLARCFRQIVTAGWANESNGDVVAPIGHFALVIIGQSELTELVDAVFEDDMTLPPDSFIGQFVVQEDSAGNTHLFKFEVQCDAEAVFKAFELSYNGWQTMEDF